MKPGLVLVVYSFGIVMTSLCDCNVFWSVWMLARHLYLLLPKAPVKYTLYVFTILLNILNFCYKLFVTIMLILDGKICTNYYFSKPKIIIVIEQVRVEVTSLDCILVVSGSSLGLGTIYPHRDCYPQLFHKNAS